MVIDIGINVPDMKDIALFGGFARQIGLTGLAVSAVMDCPVMELPEGIVVYRRVDLVGKGVNSLRKQMEQVRKSAVIIAAQLGSIDTTNWVVDDHRADLLTFNPLREYRLRETTASLAAASATFLEIQVSPLLNSYGLQRSKILKAYRETVSIATDAGMGVVLSSGAVHLMQLRSPVAMQHIGMLLGLDRILAERAVYQLPAHLIERSMRKRRPEFVSPGVEILREKRDQ